MNYSSLYQSQSYIPNLEQHQQTTELSGQPLNTHNRNLEHLFYSRLLLKVKYQIQVAYNETATAVIVIDNFCFYSMGDYFPQDFS